ncbi:MAG: hypothetical protein K2G82_00665, partial [Paramuribaculum sp.]|nr:hypothetical protein [Paramuribaculum sp.]
MLYARIIIHTEAPGHNIKQRRSDNTYDRKNYCRQNHDNYCLSKGLHTISDIENTRRRSRYNTPYTDNDTTKPTVATHTSAQPADAAAITATTITARGNNSHT